MTTYYVNQSGGKDAYAGTSLAAPFATIQRAANVVNPGDTVCVLNGTYAPFIAGRGGDFGRTVTFRSYTGAKPAIRYTMAQQWMGGIKINASWVTIQGFDISGAHWTGSVAEAQQIANAHRNDSRVNGGGIGSSYVSHITVQNCVVHDNNGPGIDLHGDYVTIKNNIVFNNAFYSPYENSGIGFEYPTNASDDGNHGYHNYIINNTSYGNRNLVGNANNHGKITDGNGIIIDMNGPNGPTYPAYYGRTLVANNLLHHNGGTGAHTVFARNVDFYFNTSAYNNQSNIYDEQLAANGSQDVNIKYNVTVADPYKNAAPLAKDSGHYDMNLMWAGSRAVAKLAPSDLVADPKFMSTGDYRLQSGSPARAVAPYSSSVPTDITGLARLAHTSLGAYANP